MTLNVLELCIVKIKIQITITICTDLLPCYCVLCSMLLSLELVVSP